MPKLSIVVPAYNVEAFIERCIRSLLDQSLPGVEIIAVDDGSTDGTGDYLEAIHQAHPDRIRVLRKETSGSPASPRNAGLSASTAEWIGFVDGDDWAELQKCLSGDSVPAIRPGCEDFDRPQPGGTPADGVIDQTDVDTFFNCLSGPAVFANPACDDL